MSRSLAGIASFVLLAGMGLAGQQPASTAAPQAGEPGKAPAANVSTRPPDPPGQPVNIKLDLAITDQSGPGDPAKKIVTMLVADRGSASIRSTGYSNVSSNVRINVDARPHILANGNIRISLGLEYNPRVADSNAAVASLNEQMTVILQPGRPVVISQSADPVSDRRVTVEATATIVK